MTSATRRQASLSAAAEFYERLVASGEPRHTAFRLAMSSVGRDSKARRVVAVPAELPALVETIVRSQVAGDWRGVLREVTTGRSRHRVHTGLRDLVAYVLTQRGYSARDIGAALGRDRSTISVQVAAFERRLATDELLAARVERLLAASSKARAA